MFKIIAKSIIFDMHKMVLSISLLFGFRLIDLALKLEIDFLLLPH